LFAQKKGIMKMACSTDEEMESLGSGNILFGVSIYKW